VVKSVLRAQLVAVNELDIAVREEDSLLSSSSLLRGALLPDVEQVIDMVTRGVCTIFIRGRSSGSRKLRVLL
jgi:hypothetical protein